MWTSSCTEDRHLIYLCVLCVMSVSQTFKVCEWGVPVFVGAYVCAHKNSSYKYSSIDI